MAAQSVFKRNVKNFEFTLHICSYDLSWWANEDFGNIFVVIICILSHIKFFNHIFILSVLAFSGVFITFCNI